MSCIHQTLELVKNTLGKNGKAEYECNNHNCGEEFVLEPLN